MEIKDVTDANKDIDTATESVKVLMEANDELEAENARLRKRLEPIEAAYNTYKEYPTSAIVKRDAYDKAINRCMSSKLNNAKNYSTQRRCFMIKTDPTMLVYDATEQPWTIGFGGRTEDDFSVITSPHRDRAICNLEPRDYKIENARLICAAPPLLKVAQKLLLWMEECMPVCDFNQDDIDLYHELRQTIRTAGGFSSETHWWQGPCICDACGHAWQGVVEIPVEATSPQVPLECGECHQMTGGPA